MTPSSLWDCVQPCFVLSEEGDWLPTVQLAGLSAHEISSVYQWIRAASQLATSQPCLWHYGQDRSIPLDELSDAASLVAALEADPFGFAVKGIHIGQVELPTLGIEVFQTSIGINYSLKDHWTPDIVYAFFSMLSRLLNLTQTGYLSLDTMGAPLAPARFVEAWNNFRCDYDSTQSADTA
jgi:hypothetical protein